jgi:hypothetical protein
MVCYVLFVPSGYELRRNRFSDGYYTAQAPPGVYDSRFPVKPPALGAKLPPREKHVLRPTMTSDGASTSESTCKRKALKPTAVTVAEGPSGRFPLSNWRGRRRQSIGTSLPSVVHNSRCAASAKSVTGIRSTRRCFSLRRLHSMSSLTTWHWPLNTALLVVFRTRRDSPGTRPGPK